VAAISLGGEAGRPVGRAPGALRLYRQDSMRFSVNLGVAAPHHVRPVISLAATRRGRWRGGPTEPVPVPVLGPDLTSASHARRLRAAAKNDHLSAAMATLRTEPCRSPSRLPCAAARPAPQPGRARAANELKSTLAEAGLERFRGPADLALDFIRTASRLRAHDQCRQERRAIG